MPIPLPLPAYPWDTRPDDHPLTADEVCAALVQSGGNITQASLALHVGSLILRKFIERSSRARAVIREMDATIADRARSLLVRALDSPDDRRADWAIRFVLQTRNARPLGYSTADHDSPDNLNRTPITHLAPRPVQWETGEAFNTPRLQSPTRPVTIDIVANPDSPPKPSTSTE